MPIGPGERYDLFLSRRGSVAAIAQEVTDVLLISPSVAHNDADSLVCVAYSPVIFWVTYSLLDNCHELVLAVLA